MSRFAGIDVSKWQGKIDWSKVQKSEINFAIIREGYGSNTLDPYFHTNVQSAQSACVNRGVYHYTYAKTISEAKKEAEFCLENIKPYKLEYPVCLDIEDLTLKNLSKRTLTDLCFAFCETIENSGYYINVYTNLDWFNNKLLKEELTKRFDIWLAHWQTETPGLDCGIWQYSDKGQIAGISGNVDLNVAYKDYSQIMKKYGLNGFSKISQEDSQNYKIVTVQKGDTLWGLSQKYLKNGSRFKEIVLLNELSNHTIYPNQQLKMPLL